MSTFCTSAAEYWLTQIDRSFGYPGYSEHSGSPAFGYQSRPLYSPYSGASSRSGSHSPSIEVWRGRRQIRSPLLGRLGRAYSRPFLDLFLFAQKTVDFGLHCLDSFLLPFCHRFSLFDEALDQQVLNLNDPGLLLW